MDINNSLATKRVSYDDLNISIIELTEYKESLPNYDLERTESRACELIYVKEGRVVYYIGENSYVLKSGNLVFIPRGTYRQAYYDNKSFLHFYVMELNCSFDNGNPVEIPPPTIFNVNQNIVIEDLYENMTKIWKEKSKGYRLMSRAIALQIFHELIFRTYNSSIKESKSNRIEFIKDYIYDNYHREISVEEIADILNLNPNYLGSYFKKKTGYTLRQYVNSVRINKAKNLLSTGRYSVSGVAEQCGYQDIYYFSKVFKEIEGVPPSAFIK